MSLPPFKETSVTMSQITSSSKLLTPTGSALGAVVAGVDASGPLPADTILALKQGLLDHHILIFKGQDLSEPQFKAFATYFGSVFNPPPDVPVLASKAGGATPEIVLVANVDGGYTGHQELTAHSDHHWAPLPSAGSLLYALEVPASGGDTSFYNMHLAYESLDAATQRRISTLELITYNPFLHQPGEPRPKYRSEAKPLISPVFPHPLVRTHPNSGKKILYLDASTEVEVVGLSPREGEALIAELRAHIDSDRFRYTHRWTVGDIVYWDNQAVLHERSAFDAGSRRVLKRISLAGSRPF
jgi:taurine dioxygenase